MCYFPFLDFSYLEVKRLIETNLLIQTLFIYREEWQTPSQMIPALCFLDICLRSRPTGLYPVTLHGCLVLRVRVGSEITNK